VTAWKELVKLDVCFSKAEANRSKTPALHLGTWELYAGKPHITGDSWQKDDVNAAMDKFLSIIHHSVRVVKVGDKIGSVAKFIGWKPGSFVISALSEPLY